MDTSFSVYRQHPTIRGQFSCYYIIGMLEFPFKDNNYKTICDLAKHLSTLFCNPILKIVRKDGAYNMTKM